MALCRRGTIFGKLIALIRLSSAPVLKTLVHPSWLKLMVYFIASKCFAAKTGFPNRSREAGGSGLSNCARSSSSGSRVFYLLTVDECRVWVSAETGSVPDSLRIRRVRLRTCWWTVFLFIQELILYSFVKRKEVLIFGYFAEPLGCFCLPVPELLFCLKLLCFCFFFIDWG